MADGRKREWFDDDEFWRELYPFMFPESRFEQAPEQMEKVLNLTQPNGTDVLDLCCGPGRCSIALARVDYAVTGVDVTPFLLDKARESGEQAGVDVEWIHADMRDFVRENAFDLVISMFTSFGYFDEKDDDLIVLRNIHKSLKPDGVCLIDVIGKERLARFRQPVMCNELEDGTMLVERNEIFDDWTRIRNRWTIVRDGMMKHFNFHHTLYSGQELKDRMRQAGFSDVALYGNLDGDEYGYDAQRLIAVACR